MILALDIASKTGWAAGVAQSVPVTGTISLHGSIGEKMLTFSTALIALCEEHQPDLIIFEQPIHTVVRNGSSNVLRLALGLCAAAEMVAHRQGVKPVEAPMQTWRKHFLGVSKAPASVAKSARRKWIKAQSIERCRILGWGTLSDDEAEACGIWDYAWSLRSKAHQVHTAPGLFQGA